jgi:hypothetical protein
LFSQQLPDQTNPVGFVEFEKAFTFLSIIYKMTELSHDETIDVNIVHKIDDDLRELEKEVKLTKYLVLK